MKVITKGISKKKCLFDALFSCVTVIEIFFKLKKITYEQINSKKVAQNVVHKDKI